MLFGRSSSVSYHLSAETHQERIMIASTELDEEVFRGRAEENPESARSVIYAIFSAHNAYFNVLQQKVPYFNVSRQNRVVFNCFATKQC